MFAAGLVGAMHGAELVAGRNQPQPSRIFPDDFDAAQRLYLAGDYKKCLAAVDDVLAAESSGAKWFQLKLKCLLVLGRYDDAVQTYNGAKKLYMENLALRRLGVEALRFCNATVEARALWNETVDLSRTFSRRYSGAEDMVLLGELALQNGVDPKTVLKQNFEPFAETDFEANMAIGRLGLEKGDFALAAEHFAKATELHPDDPDGFFGLAKAYEPSDSDKSNEALQTALRLNPHHIPSLLHVAEDRIDGELYDEATDLLERILQINPKQPRALAFRAVIAHLQNQPALEGSLRKQALSTWQGNPEVDYWIGKKLSQKYLFTEGAEYQRRALVYDANYLPAKIQLAQDLLRLGDELEGWKLADEVNAADGYNILAHNLVALRDSLAGYGVIRNDDFIVRMDAREAHIYGDEVLRLLGEAKSQVCAKYEMKISRPIMVEIFARQQDFAIRTFGMPGGAGFLGVCFGKVVTMNSPATQGSSPSNWESVLWHEFCHVVTLQKTNNKMPRWLSEGISVYEERRPIRLGDNR